MTIAKPKTVSLHSKYYIFVNEWLLLLRAKTTVKDRFVRLDPD